MIIHIIIVLKEHTPRMFINNIDCLEIMLKLGTPFLTGKTPRVSLWPFVVTYSDTYK